MKTFKNFINEQHEETLTGYKLVLALKEKLKKDCSFFFNESKKLPMLRGADLGEHQKGEKWLPKTFVKQSIRTDRKTRNSHNNPFFFWSFNAAVEHQFGIKDIRSKSLFCTGNIGMARYYGDINFVFPIGQFKYIWSPEINDSYEDIHLMHFSDIQHTGEKSGEFESSMQYYPWLSKMERIYINKWIENKEFNLDDLSQTESKVLQIAAPIIKKNFEKYNYQFNQNLDGAIKSGNEIFIIAPAEYYSVSKSQLAMALGLKSEAPHEVIYEALMNEIFD